MWRPVSERLAALLVAGVVLCGASCILGPKQDDPDSIPTGDDGGFVVDAAKNPEVGGLSDSGGGSSDAASDAPPGPPDRCDDQGDGGDAGDADAHEGGCGDARDDSDATDAPDSGDDSLGDVVTGG